MISNSHLNIISGFRA